MAPPLRVDGRRFYQVVSHLCEISERQWKRTDYFSRCFEVIAEYLEASVGMLNLRLGARTLERVYSTEETFTDQWTKIIDPLLLRAQTDEEALTKPFRNRAGKNVAYSMAAPILSGGGKPFGAVAFVIAQPNIERAESQLAQVHQLLELVVENAPAANQVAGDKKNESQTLQSVVRASDYRSIHHLSFAIVNSLCSKFRCEQVAIGIVRNRDVRLMAVSGLSEIPKNTPGMIAVQQSMAVCYDRNETTVVQQTGRLVGQIEPSSCKMHQFWHRLTGESSVATIPLRIENQCVAVVSVRRPASQPWMPEDIERIRILAESFAPALPLVDRASRSILRHMGESFLSVFAQWYSWKRLGPKAIAVVLCLVMLWFMFGTTNHRILAPCKIVPEQVYTVSAPHEALIANVFVLPGQAVKEGDLLIQLGTKDLLIERKRILASIASTQIKMNALLHERKTQEAFLQQAEIEVLQTDLNLIEAQIQRSQIRAHQDGVVLPTEIHQRVGQFVALGESLLEIANEEKWHLEVEIPESSAPYLTLDQSGSFQSTARPDQTLACEITKISPSSQILRKKNVVIAEAVLREKDAWMKLGMEGYVRIDAGSRPVWWVYLHPVMDYVRLKLWL